MSSKSWKSIVLGCFALFVLSLVGGCASVPEKEVQASTPVDCGAPESGALEVLKPGALVLLGEMHGTTEIPWFVGRLACHAAHSRDLRVRVGLEIPMDDQDRIEAFLSSPAGDDREDGKNELLQGDFWTRELQDGRSSEAMFELLVRLRELRRTGAEIAVFAFDGGGGKGRDELMAKNIAAAIERIPGNITLVLTGNIHAKVAKGVPWDADFVPMGWYLVQAEESVTALDNSYTGGTVWACMGQAGQEKATCKEHPIRGADRGSEPFVELFTAPENGYHGIFHLGSVTASPPAVERK